MAVLGTALSGCRIGSHRLCWPGMQCASRRVCRHWLSSTIVSAALLGSILASTVAAASSQDPAITATPADPAMAPAAEVPEPADLQSLYLEGKAKFETYDYAGAIATWTEVYARLGQSDHEREIQLDLIFNIAVAHELAFEQDHDRTHLTQAKQLLESYVEGYKNLYEATDEHRAHIDQVEQRIAALDARPVPVPPPASLAPPSPKSQLRALLRSDPELHSAYRRSRHMVTAGAILLGVGGTLLISGAANLSVQHDPVFPSTESTLMIVGSTAIVTGAIVLGVGIATKRRTIHEARGRIVFAPSIGAPGLIRF